MNMFDLELWPGWPWQACSWSGPELVTFGENLDWFWRNQRLED